MKVRIQGNSIRLRLTQSEVKQFSTIGQVKEHIRFGPEEENGLTYALEIYRAEGMSATFDGKQMKVLVPKEMALIWAGSELVGMEELQDLNDEEQLKILVEKDFKCLTDRPDEDESDHFPHPKEDQMNC